MILFEAVLLGLLIGIATGGRFKGFEVSHVRGDWVLLVLLVFQLAWPSAAPFLGVSAGIALIAWLLMMALLALILFMNARDEWSLAVAGLGIALNVFVIGLNGAMPVSMDAVAITGMDPSAAREALQVALVHAELTPATLAPVLADVIPVPGPQWHRAVVSIGDILLAGGLAVWVCTALRRGKTTGIHAE